MFVSSIRNTLKAAQICGCPSCRYCARALSEAVLAKLSFDLAEVAANFLPLASVKNR
jgi:hypothetical protein